MTKTYEHWKPISFIIDEYIDTEKDNFVEKFKWNIINPDEISTNEYQVKDILDELQVTMNESIEIGDLDLSVEFSGWMIVGPHSDRDDNFPNATGFNGDPYAVFLFLHTDRHILQYDFEKNTTSWEDNHPSISQTLTSGDMVIMNIKETHALGLENDEHLDWMNVKDTSTICEILKKNSERILIGLMIGYENKPTKEQALSDMEKIVSYQLERKNKLDYRCNMI